MIRAIAWDIDGTLVDSEPLHLFALKQVCASHDVDISDLDDDHFIGVHLGNVWKALQPRFPSGTRFKAWLAELNDAYQANASRLVEIDSAAHTVRQLAAMGLRQIAVSNSNRVVVDANLRALGIEGAFDASISLDDVMEGKPDPFPYRLACARLGLKPREVLAVEDSVTGAASALAAGLPLAFLGECDALDGASPIASLWQVPSLVEERSGAGQRTHSVLQALS